MKRVLMVEYSQSGDVTKVADAFSRSLNKRAVEIHRERLQPVVAYPYPWRSLWRLFSVWPECFVGPPDAIQPPAFSLEDRFDLVILSYQVWHLSPSIPVQAFLCSEHARVLRNRPVITLCVSRNMWHSASEAMKRLLHERDAFHLDNVVVTHQGPPLATFVSVVRTLVTGKRDPLWGIFPPAGPSQQDLERTERLGAVVAARLDDLQPPCKPFLTGLGAVTVRRRQIVPELIGWYLYRAGARLVAGMSSRGSGIRRLLIFLCVCASFLAIPLVMTLSIITVFLLSPLVRGRIDRYARQLAGPSG